MLTFMLLYFMCLYSEFTKTTATTDSRDEVYDGDSDQS